MDDPFSGLELISSSPDQKNVLNNTTNDNLEAPNDNNDSDIETAVEADEFLILESGDNSETLPIKLMTLKYFRKIFCHRKRSIFGPAFKGNGGQ